MFTGGIPGGTLGGIQERIFRRVSGGIPGGISELFLAEIFEIILEEKTGIHEEVLKNISPISCRNDFKEIP